MKLIFSLILFFLITISYAQSDSTRRPIPEKRLRNLVVGSSIGYGIAMTGLHQLWYKNSARQPFTFFNDHAEWKQLDKAGHFYSAFNLSYGASKAFAWAGVAENKSDLIGALTAFGILLPIEVFDGYSDAYGASIGDVLANSGGALFYLGQKSLWKEVRLYPKFSFHRTPFAPRRPELLGENVFSEAIKDYNGQTYWLSVDMDKFVRFPKWVNLAVGYGAEGMLYARTGDGNDRSVYRQYYFSIDLDLSSIKTKSKALKSLLFVANMIHIPFPAIEFSRNSTKFHPAYF